VLIPNMLFSANAAIDLPDLGRVPVMVRDVSLKGVRFAACVRAEVGSEFVLNVDVAGRQIRMPCRIVRVTLTGESVSERLYMHGCRFVGLSERDAQTLAALAWM
jgi:hypothetical protein